MAVRLVARLNQSARARPAGVQQHREVTDFLRDLVGRNGERSGDAKLEIGEEGRGDQHAVERVVQGVAREHEPGGTVFMRIVVVLAMAMAPQHELLEHEEEQQAADEREPDAVRPALARALDGMRQERQQRRAEQRTGGETHEVRQAARPGEQDMGARQLLAHGCPDEAAEHRTFVESEGGGRQQQRRPAGWGEQARGPTQDLGRRPAAERRQPGQGDGEHQDETGAADEGRHRGTCQRRAAQDLPHRLGAGMRQPNAERETREQRQRQRCDGEIDGRGQAFREQCRNGSAVAVGDAEVAAADAAEKPYQLQADRVVEAELVPQGRPRLGCRPITQHAHDRITDKTGQREGHNGDQQQHDEAMAETEHERGQAGRLRKLSSQHLPGMATGSFRFRPRAWWLSFRLTASPTRHVAAAVRLDLGSADHHELRRRQLPPGKRGSANGQRRPDRV